MTHFFETMFFSPKWYHYPIMVLLLPLSFLYGAVMWLRRKWVRAKKYTIPIVSVGNLIVGGSGKTPFVIALASRYSNVFVISRGYGRESKGLVEVSIKGKILTEVRESGDEAMLMAISLPHASVIVSENREDAIDLALEKGAKLIVLDDGFNRVEIQKYEILLEPKEIENYYPFPSGPFREFFFTRKYADMIIQEGKAYVRKVEIDQATQRMVLVTAISNPKRLDRYLPAEVVDKVYYEDHAYFNEEVLKEILKAQEATSILCTSKDRVKMQNFKLPISEMKLELEIKNEIFTQVDAYIKGHRNEK